MLIDLLDSSKANGLCPMGKSFKSSFTIEFYKGMIGK